MLGLRETHISLRESKKKKQQIIYGLCAECGLKKTNRTVTIVQGEVAVMNGKKSCMLVQDVWPRENKMHYQRR